MCRKDAAEVVLSTEEINRLETVAETLPTEQAVLYLRGATGLSECTIREWVRTRRNDIPYFYVLPR